MIVTSRECEIDEMFCWTGKEEGDSDNIRGRIQEWMGRQFLLYIMSVGSLDGYESLPNVCLRGISRFYEYLDIRYGRSRQPMIDGHTLRT